MSNDNRRRQEELKRLYDYNPETGIFIQKTTRGGKIAGSIAGSLHSSGYIHIRFEGKPQKAHRLAFLFMEGYIPEEVDHINRVRNDNRWANLKESSRSENNSNVKRKNKSGYSGVHWNKRDLGWQVTIRKKGVSYSNGFFEYSELPQAVEAANKLRLDLYGKSALIEEFDGKLPSIEDLV